jgi:hypothetical protein
LQAYSSNGIFISVFVVLGADGREDEAAELVLLHSESRNAEPIKDAKNRKATNPDMKVLLEEKKLSVQLIFFEVALPE